MHSNDFKEAVYNTPQNGFMLNRIFLNIIDKSQNYKSELAVAINVFKETNDEAAYEIFQVKKEALVAKYSYLEACLTSTDFNDAIKNS